MESHVVARIGGALFGLLIFLALLLHAAPVVAGDFERALMEMERFKETAGVAPSLDDYYLTIEGNDFTAEQQGRLYFAVVAQQKGLVSLEDLLTLLAAKRDSIRSYRCKYLVSTEPAEQRTFMFSANKLLLSDGSLPVTISYDGEFFRRVEAGHSASIEGRRSLQMFYRHEMPLARAMLLDQRLVEITNGTCDIVEFLKGREFVVFEQTQMIDGVNCLLVANTAFEVFLDIDRNFAMKRLSTVSNDLIRDKKGEFVVVRHRIAGQSLHSNFVDYGNGIWLPTKIVVDHGDGGDPTVTDVVEAEVNSEIADSEFSGVIPDKASVADNVRRVAYKQGQSSTIESMLNTSTPDRGRERRLLMYANVFLFSAVAVYYAWVSWKGRRRATK